MVAFYNKESGKFIGYLKETKTGNANYSEVPTDQGHLEKIKAGNLYDDSLKPYSYKGSSKSGSVYGRVNEYVERFIAGDKMDSPEDLQFYENNKNKIKKKLQAKKPTVKKKAEPKPDGQLETTEVKPLPPKEEKIKNSWFSGKEVSFQEGMTEKDYIKEVLANSEDAGS